MARAVVVDRLAAVAAVAEVAEAVAVVAVGCVSTSARPGPCRLSRGLILPQTNGTGENGVLPLTDTTTDAANAQNTAEGAATAADKDAKPRAPRQPRQRGPPEDGIPSKNKVMVANLPYDLSEEKVGCPFCFLWRLAQP